MNLRGVARPLRLEQLARRLTGKRSDESAQRLVTLRVDLVVLRSWTANCLMS